MSVAGAGDPGGAILVAEGDSWFDYPWHDVLNFLEDDYNYSVESVAHHGDSIENMAYADGQLDGFAAGSGRRSPAARHRRRSSSRAAATTLRATSSRCS